MFGKATYLRSASLAAISALPIILGCEHANALTFDFNMTSNRGTITGEIDGLSNNSTGPASAVIINSLMPLNNNFPTNFPTPPVNVTASPWTVDPNHDSFTVTNNEITGTDFLSQLLPATVTQVCFSSSSACGATVGGNVGQPGQTGLISTAPNFQFLAADPTFTLTSAPEPMPEIPLPATLPLFASGLGALGLFGWRRKRRVLAVA